MQLRYCGKLLAEYCDVPFLGRIPLDPRCSESSDIGVPYVVKYPDSPASHATLAIVDKITDMIEKAKEERLAAAK